MLTLCANPHTMAVIYFTYDSVKDTLPKKTDVEGVEADFSAFGGRLIRIDFSGSPSVSGANPTDEFTEGDYIVCLDADYVGLITRVVDGNTLEVASEHGLADEEVECAVVRYSTQFKDFSILNDSGGVALVKGKGGEYMELPTDSADGGQGWSDNDGFPLIIDAATNSTTVQVKAMY